METTGYAVIVAAVTAALQKVDAMLASRACVGLHRSGLEQVRRHLRDALAATPPGKAAAYVSGPGY